MDEMETREQMQFLLSCAGSWSPDGHKEVQLMIMSKMMMVMLMLIIPKEFGSSNTDDAADE